MKRSYKPCLLCSAFSLAVSLSTVQAVDTTAWTGGHGDVTVNYLNNAWEFGVSIDSIPGTMFEPGAVTLQAGDNARLAIPSNPSFSFLGAAGAPIWIYPQNPTAGLPHVGVSAEATPAATFVNDRFNLFLNRVDGPGSFFMWTTGGSGTPTVHMNASDGITSADVFNVPSGGHNHVNWGFSSPGTYRLGVIASGTLSGQSSPTVSDETEFLFEVSVLKEGDVDIDVAFVADALHLGIHREVTDTEFESDHVALKVAPPAWGRVPEDPAFAFLGEARSEVLILPQNETEGLLFLGIAGGEIPLDTFVDNQISLQLIGVDGPGQVALFETDSFGAPTSYFNSADGIDSGDAYPVAVGDHSHANWAFTEPGIYRIHLQASGTLQSGSQAIQSETATFLFEVFAPAFFEQGEADVDVAYEEGEFHLGFHQESTGTEIGADEAVIRALPFSRSVIPGDPQFSFLGSPGDATYVLPQNEREGVLFLGVAGEEIAPGIFVGDEVSLNLVGFSGPGTFALFANDAFGTPTVFMNTADGLTAADGFPVASGTHTHVNWAFSQPGVYELQMQASGTLVSGSQPVQSELTTFRVDVIAPEILDQGEIDFEVVFGAGGWELALLDEAAEREIKPEAALLVAGPESLDAVPADGAFSFLGTASDPVWILPQAETEGLLFLGIAGDEIAPGTFDGDTVFLQLTAASGPGEFAMYDVDGFGTPTVYMNTRDGIDTADRFPVPVGGHVHINWAFSAPGDYRLTFKATGTLTGETSPSESGTITLAFAIEDAGPILEPQLASGGSELQLNWMSKNTVSYQLQSRTALGSGSWQNEGSVISGAGGIQSIAIPKGGETLKVFQLIEVQP